MRVCKDEHLRVFPKFKEDIREVKKDVEEFKKENKIKTDPPSDREITKMITKHKHWKRIIKDLKEYFVEDDDE